MATAQQNDTIMKFLLGINSAIIIWAGTTIMRLDKSDAVKAETMQGIIKSLDEGKQKNDAQDMKLYKIEAILNDRMPSQKKRNQEED